MAAKELAFGPAFGFANVASLKGVPFMGSRTRFGDSSLWCRD
jgi:hypothetical protein